MKIRVTSDGLQKSLWCMKLMPVLMICMGLLAGTCSFAQETTTTEKTTVKTKKKKHGKESSTTTTTTTKENPK